LDSLGFTWNHLGSFGLHMESHGFTWTHLDPLELTWTPLDLLGFNRTHLGSIGFTWIHLDSAGIIWSHLESFGVAWSHLDSLGLRNPGTHSRIQAFIERSCRTGALVRNRTSSLLGQLRAVNPATNITSVLWIRLPPPTPPAPSPQNSVEPPLPRKQCWSGSGSKKKKVEGPTKHMSPQHCFWGEGGGLGHSDKKRVGQQTEVMFVAGWIDF
jgi:hypothetical protein